MESDSLPLSSWMYFTTIFFLQLFHLFHNSLSLLESLWQREKKCGILFMKQEMRIWFQRMGFTLWELLGFSSHLFRVSTKVPHIPLLSGIFSENRQKWPSDVLLKGWSMPQKQWEECLDCLAKDHGSIWNQSGICDAMISSRYELRCHEDVIFGLLEYWCPETNTLVFHGERQPLLLKISWILLGFLFFVSWWQSLLRGIRWKLKKRWGNIERKCIGASWRKPTMGLGSSILWTRWVRAYRVFALRLSRFVLPSLPEHTIQKHDFAIAIHLSEGTKIALAPAVLASLWKNLRLLKEQAAAAAASGSITVSGPLQIVQQWAFERFPLLGPQCPNLLKHGEPRAARWHKLNSKISLPLTRSVLKVPDNFKWLPYADNLDNRHHSSYYKEDDLWFTRTNTKSKSYSTAHLENLFGWFDS